MRNLSLSSRVRKVLQGRSRGLTLVELVIAMAFIGIIAVALLGGLSNAIMSLVVADVRTTAESLARSQTEYVKDQDYDPALEGGEGTYFKLTQAIPDGYTIWSVNRDDEIVEDVIGIPWDSEGNQPLDEDNGLQRIKLVIRHDDQVVITLVSYKVDR